MIDGGYSCDRCGAYSTYKHQPGDCISVFQSRAKRADKALLLAETFIHPLKRDEYEAKKKALK